MSPWLVCFAAGVVSARLLDLVKIYVAVPRRVRPVVAVLLPPAVAYGLDVWANGPSIELAAPVLLGAVGVAWITHEAAGFLQAAKDRSRLEIQAGIMARRPGR